MAYETNELGQPLDAPVPGWKACPRPTDEAFEGSWCRLEPLRPDHATGLFQANASDEDGAIWTYLPYGPFESEAAYADWIASVSGGTDPFFYAIIDLGTGKVTGVASYLRINPAMGSIEVGHINYSPLMQKTPAGTEAMYLMMRQAFSLGYRRYEWKCNALNEKSCKAARRLGFTPEGIHRQAGIYKGRNRDTAWFSILDSEWPAIQAEMERWLRSDNFDATGAQKSRLNCP
ncbi:GNAT family N-acetyltransferase [Aestuariispira insulae]|uniref:RimJ/RimL family protein N-acetyltransferase n=1 Tax=Aestuariispira insulae TaxID=1461337 RepID=A0A3D9HXZ9_9PROT|nr:GNAT family protein [Aestuariispira insulae]RED54378.1 RimJ/RimL family protein N-acetyltransferase [Aestuariispira insulae]